MHFQPFRWLVGEPGQPTDRPTYRPMAPAPTPVWQKANWSPAEVASVHLAGHRDLSWYD
jgi:hypothetical protein